MLTKPGWGWLVLMGEKNIETPPQECVQRLTLAKSNGALVQWHVYPDTTHCWDCKNLHKFSKADFRGTSVVYRYDAMVTRDCQSGSRRQGNCRFSDQSTLAPESLMTLAHLMASVRISCAM